MKKLLMKLCTIAAVFIVAVSLDAISASADFNPTVDATMTKEGTISVKLDHIEDVTYVNGFNSNKK